MLRQHTKTSLSGLLVALTLSGCGALGIGDKDENVQKTSDRRDQILVNTGATGPQPGLNGPVEDRVLRDRFRDLEGVLMRVEERLGSIEGRLNALEARQTASASEAMTAQRDSASAFNAELESLKQQVATLNSVNRNQAQELQRLNADAERARQAAMPARYTVHLSSYRTIEQARVGWRQLAAAFGAPLSELKPYVVTEQQDGLGSFIKLQAGPLNSQQAADELCATLKRMSGDQFCAVMRLAGDPLQ